MTRWLNADEQRLWRGWLAASMLLPDRLNRDLQQSHGLTDTDYMILVELSETPRHRMRMSSLAELTLLSRSRLSHQVDRMERAGLVIRTRCSEDGRGTYAELTERGYQTLVAAAPDHVESVRRNLMDALTPAEFAALGEACIKVSEHLGGCHLTTEPTGETVTAS